MKILRAHTSDAQTIYGALQPDATTLRIEGDIFGTFTVTSEIVSLDKLLAPVPPAVVFGIGLNYRQHAAECGREAPAHPVLFMKAPNAIQNPGDPILLPRHLRSDKVDYECELAVVIGKRCRNVSPKDALDHVLGYTCLNDISARDWQMEWGGGQWCRAKTFDTFAPLGPWLVTPDELPDPNDLTIRTILNGDIVQESSTRDMIFDVRSLISFLSGSTTLLPGTIIATGTPQGVGMARKPPLWLRDGDQITVQIQGIGDLTNPVEDEPL